MSRFSDLPPLHGLGLDNLLLEGSLVDIIVAARPGRTPLLRQFTDFLADEFVFILQCARARHGRCLKILRCKLGGPPDIDVHVLAEFPDLLDLLVVTEFEALKQERCLQPRTIQLGNVHAWLEVVDDNLDLLNTGGHATV